MRFTRLTIALVAVLASVLLVREFDGSTTPDTVTVPTRVERTAPGPEAPAVLTDYTGQPGNGPTNDATFY